MKYNKCRSLCVETRCTCSAILAPQPAYQVVKNHHNNKITIK